MGATYLSMQLRTTDRAPVIAALHVTFSSDLLRALCETAGIRHSFSSFDYLQRGEREGLDGAGQLTLVPGDSHA